VSSGSASVLYPSMGEHLLLLEPRGSRLNPLGKNWCACVQSDCVLHRVRPAHAERFCLTIWLDGTDVNRQA
jgi:hypothetical protein